MLALASTDPFRVVCYVVIAAFLLVVLLYLREVWIESRAEGDRIMSSTTKAFLAGFVLGVAGAGALAAYLCMPVWPIVYSDRVVCGATG